MTCNQVHARDLVKHYIAGTLAEDDSSSFENHYIACGRCFADLETARTRAGRARKRRNEPRPTAKIWLLLMAPIAAWAAVGVIAAMIWQNTATLSPAPVMQKSVAVAVRGLGAPSVPKRPDFAQIR